MDSSSFRKSSLRRSRFLVNLLTGMLLMVSVFWIIPNFETKQPTLTPSETTGITHITNNIVPLVMTEGDPHLRALMRTISASESYDASPYTILS